MRPTVPTSAPAQAVSPMRPRPFTFAAAASAVVCVGVCGLWVRSYLPAFVWITSVQGRLIVIGIDTFPPDADRIRTQEGDLRWLARDIEAGATSSSSVLGVKSCSGLVSNRDSGSYYDFTVATGYPYWSISIPLLYCLLPCVPLPVIYAALGLRRRRRILRGLCPVCGYDLRATPGRCPECGAVPEQAKGAAA